MSPAERLLSGHGFAIFSRDPAFCASTLHSYFSADRDIRHVIITYHPTTPPELVDGACAAAAGAEVRMIPWADYGEPANVRAVGDMPPEALAFVSLDHHRTVHDRLDPRRAYIRRKGAKKKIAVDSIPYEALPWRVYFPFAFFDTGPLGYHHSYAIEQDYERFLDGQLTDNPCDPDRIAERTWRHAFVERSAGFVSLPTVHIVPVSGTEHAEYALHRDRLFDSEKTIASVKKKLSDWIQERHPRRSIPTDLKRVYQPGFNEIVRTDLPFDRWLASEVMGLMEHTNKLVDSYLRHTAEGQ